jgi:localization factor PodJL
MKFGGPWNLRGLRPEVREAARGAARESGMSVGEWLNTVIMPDRDEDQPTELRQAERDVVDEGGHRSAYDERDNDARSDADGRNRSDRPRLEGDPGRGQQASAEREPDRKGERPSMREGRQPEPDRGDKPDTAASQNQLGALHGRLDALSSQLKRLAQTEIIQRRLLSRGRETAAESVEAAAARLTGSPVPPRRAKRSSVRADSAAGNSELSIDAVVAEIVARQHALDDEEPARTPVSPSLAPTEISIMDEIAAQQAALDGEAPGRAVDLLAPPPSLMDVRGLERQLQIITARIEELRPASDLAKSIEAVRIDLTEIAHELSGALPRRAVEPLEIEIKALAQRIDQSRQSGADATALAGLEHGLEEIRDVLRGLTTSERLVGFTEAVNGLAQKLEFIAAKDDPAALQQLETAIGALRGIVSHVASSEALTKVADDVRALAATVDALASRGVAENALSELESRVATLTSALAASAEAGQAVPREVEKLLAGLIDKLEWVQLTHTDHAALAHLEDRIALLVKRFDASEARFVHLEAIERGLADLLVHIDQLRGGNGPIAKADAPVATERDVAEIKQNDRRTQDSIEDIHGTVEHMVNRLAMIENNIRSDSATQPSPTAPLQANPDSVAPEPEQAAAAAAAATTPTAAPQQQVALNRTAAREPIDANLPPDHPIEPGAAASRSRSPTSAADRIAASEANSARPPIIPDPGGKSNFIAAARRAAQIAAATSSEPQSGTKNGGETASSLPGKLTKRLRALLVAGSAVVIVLFCLHIASKLLLGGGSDPIPVATPEQAAPTATAPTDATPANLPPSEAAPLLDQSPTPSTPSSEPPGSRSGAATGSSPDQQPAAARDDGDTGSISPTPPSGQPTANALPLWAMPDITGSVLQHSGPTATSAPASSENLPAAIGGPALRAAALSGDPSAAYEVAMRFAEGRGVPQNDDEAVRWLQRAAQQGLAPAQFRLGTFYEKGAGVKRDLGAAHDLYLAAANKGNGKAMHNVAVLYAEGINGPPDYRSAAHWFQKAADVGVADSQYNLGILYARGIGVQQNFAESYKWFALAANQGDKEAAKKRDEVAGKLDPQSLTAAQLSVRTWSAQPQPDAAINVKVPPGGWDAPAKAAQPLKSKPHPGSAKAATPDDKVD